MWKIVKHLRFTSNNCFHTWLSPSITYLATSNSIPISVFPHQCNWWSPWAKRLPHLSSILSLFQSLNLSITVSFTNVSFTVQTQKYTWDSFHAKHQSITRHRPVDFVTASFTTSYSRSSDKTHITFKLSHSRLCPLHTQGHRIWFGCPGVTAATELLNIR